MTQMFIIICMPFNYFILFGWMLENHNKRRQQEQISSRWMAHTCTVSWAYNLRLGEWHNQIPVLRCICFKYFIWRNISPFKIARHWELFVVHNFCIVNFSGSCVFKAESHNFSAVFFFIIIWFIILHSLFSYRKAVWLVLQKYLSLAFRK